MSDLEAGKDPTLTILVGTNKTMIVTYASRVYPRDMDLNDIRASIGIEGRTAGVVRLPDSEIIDLFVRIDQLVERYG